MEFTSRRPLSLGQNGAVSCDDPHASRAGLDILRLGGNAADAAIAMAAVLNVTNPMVTGLGGDAFCLFYNAQNKEVDALNGSGRCSSNITLATLQAEGFSEANPPPVNHGHWVTVPGAAAAWVDTVEKFGSGKLSLTQILQPAISLAEEGHPVSEIAATFWKRSEWLFHAGGNKHGRDMLLNNTAPKWGQIFKNPHLAKTIKVLGEEGKYGFYNGHIAQAIVAAVKECGGTLSSHDLADHVTTFEEPISTNYKNIRLWEIPPNGQGIVALMALNILKGYDIKLMHHNSSQYLHILIEALRLSFADAMQQVADPSKVEVPIKKMLSEEYAHERRKLISDEKALEAVEAGDMRPGMDTVYLSATDKDGNACSFINSNYMGFGTGIVPERCGFTLQNRGFNFSLNKNHPNSLCPGKRPYHTIIPAMLTDNRTGELLACYGVMGGFMQPQGHVQVLLNMLEFGMNPQQALDAPRFCIGSGHASAVGSVAVEKGIKDDVIEELRKMGHDTRGPVSGHERALFGRGHVITRGAWWSQDGNIHDDPSVWWAGGDPRADGHTLAY